MSPCYVFNSQIHTQRISPFLPSEWVDKELLAGYNTTHSLGIKQAIKGCFKYQKAYPLKHKDSSRRKSKLFANNSQILREDFLTESMLITEVGLVRHGSTSCGARNVLSCPTKVHFVDVNSYAPRLNDCLHIGLHKIPNVHLHQLPIG